MNRQPFHPKLPVTDCGPGQRLRRLRQQARLSQLDLALIAGVSQRHLSCIETGRANASPSTLHALLLALDAPLEHCNEVFLAAGYAPRYGARPIEAPGLAMVHDAISHILAAHNPAPALVIDSHWNVTSANTSTGLLMAMAGVHVDTTRTLNLLDTLLSPGGLGDHLINAQQIRSLAWQRAAREAASNAELAERLQHLPRPHTQAPETPSSPMVLTQVRSGSGVLSFLSTFTTFGMPLDITVASLRIEHLIPADETTWEVMRAAYGQWKTTEHPQKPVQEAV